MVEPRFVLRTNQPRGVITVASVGLLLILIWTLGQSRVKAQADPSAFQRYAVFSSSDLNALRSKNVRLVYILVDGQFCGAADVPALATTEEHEVRLDSGRVAAECFRVGARAQFVSYDNGRIFDGHSVVGQEPLRMVSTEYEAAGTQTTILLPRYVRDTLVQSVVVFAGERKCGEIALHDFASSSDDLAAALVLDSEGVPGECMREGTLLTFVIPERDDVPSRATTLSFRPPVVPGVRILLTGLSASPPDTGAEPDSSGHGGLSTPTNSWIVPTIFAFVVVISIGAAGLSRRYAGDRNRV